MHAGATYDGHQGTTYSDLVVSRDGSRLRGFEFQFKSGSCSDGGKYGSDIAEQISSGAHIDAKGRATYDHRYGNAYWYTRHGKRVTGSERVSFSVRFAGDKVAGTLRDQFDSSHLHCSSKSMEFVAYRDGTPQAPVRTDQVETGKYHGAARNGGTPFSSDVYVPWSLVNQFNVSWKARCRNRGSLGGGFVFGSLPITHNDFQRSGSDKFTLKGGYRGRERYRLSGHFFRRQGDPTYRVSGSWDYTAWIYKGSRQVTTCPLSVTLAGVAG